jgi:aspartokinase
MKVVKFGGSSLASAGQLEKVFNIVQSDSERRFVVVSAPGKRNAEDTKVTDALIKYYREYVDGKDVTASQEWIINRYQAMVDELGFSANSMKKIAENIISLANLPINDNEFLYDTFLSAGEDNNAKLIAEYFTFRGLPAGLYNVKVEDSNGCCSINNNIELLEPDELINVSTLSGNKILLTGTGGVGAYTFTVLDPTTSIEYTKNSAPYEFILPLTPNNLDYIVDISDSNGCESPNSLTIKYV